MVVFPNAKINIGLQITDKRSDGFHNLLSLFYPVPWKDVLEILPAEKFSLHIVGLSIPGEPADNSLTKAYQLLHNKYAIDPVEIILYKNIPMGAGLGGGSADAAFGLRLLNDYFGLALSDVRLMEYAILLGSDCPYFIKNTPQMVSGRGEIMEDSSLSLKGYNILIIYPDVFVSTAKAYKLINTKSGRPSLYELLELPISKWQGVIINAFQNPVEQAFPRLKELNENIMHSAPVYAAMSGSGSAYFALYNENERPQALISWIEQNHYRFIFAPL